MTLFRTPFHVETRTKKYVQRISFMYTIKEKNGLLAGFIFYTWNNLPVFAIFFYSLLRWYISRRKFSHLLFDFLEQSWRKLAIPNFDMHGLISYHGIKNVIGSFYFAFRRLEFFAYYIKNIRRKGFINNSSMFLKSCYNFERNLNYTKCYFFYYLSSLTNNVFANIWIWHKRY